MKRGNEQSMGNGRGNRLTTRLLCGASLTAVALLALPSAAHAQSDRYWDPNATAPNSGGSGTWNTNSNQWSPNGDGVSGPYTAWNNSTIDNAIFAGPNATNATVTLAAPITVHNLTVNANTTYTLTGSTLTLAGTTPTITTNGTATISSILAGNAGLTTSGVGTLTLTGANTFSGGINVNQGSLVVSGDSALGAASNGITLSAGTAFQSTSALAATRVITLAGTASLGLQAGSARITGTGGLNLNAALTLSNDANDFTGPVNSVGNNLFFTSIGDLGVASSLGAATTAANGLLSVGGSASQSATATYLGGTASSNRNWSIGIGTSSLVNAGTGTLNLGGTIGLTNSGFGVTFEARTADLGLSGVISGTRPVIFLGSSTARTITLGDSNTFAGTVNINIVTVKANTLANGGLASSLGTSGNIALSAGVLSYIGAGGGTDRILSINGTSSVLNDGTGALALSGAVSFLAGGAADTLTLGGGFAGNNSLSGVLSGSGNIVMNGAAGSTWLLSGTNTYVGTITVTGGTLQAGNDQAFGSTPNAVTVNGGTLDLNAHDLNVKSLAGIGGSVALNGGADLTINGATSTTYAGSITGNGSLLKRGTSTLTLTGQNTYTGATTINGGAIVLDFSAASAPATNILSGSSSLNMTGGALTLIGAATANSQNFNGLNVSAGNNRITMTAGASGMVLNLGALNHTGGLLDFTTSGTSDITTTSGDGALGWATINGSDYAQVTGGHIVAFTAYAAKDNASTWANGDVVADTGGTANTPFANTVTGNVELGGLKYTAANASTVTVGTGNTLGVDGTIIVGSSVNNASQTITGGSITGAAGGGTFGVLDNSTGAGTFTIASTIVDNGAGTSFVKGGAGKVALTSANSYTGGTTISGGTLAIDSVANGGSASSLGASGADSANLVLESGTLEYTGVGGGTTDRGLTLVNGGPSRTILVDSGNLSLGGVVVGPDDAGFSKTGAGTLTLANAANTYTGSTTVSGGTLSVNTLANGGVASGIGASSANSANLLIQTGGTLQYTGTTANTDRGFTINGAAGATVDVVNAGTVLTIGGTVDKLGIAPLHKAGAGTLVLAGTNVYTGTTFIDNGTLQAGSTQAFGVSNIMTFADVAGGVTLDLNGFDNKVNALVSSGANGGTVRLGSATLTVGGTDATFSGTITGTGGVFKDNSNTQTLLGCNNTYTGVTNVHGGTLSVDCLANGGQASGIGASTNASANLVLSGGTLAYTGGSITIDRGISLTGTGIVEVVNAATVLGISGPIVGGALEKDGDGTLVLSGGNSYVGDTTVTGGVLRAGIANALGTRGSLSLNDTAGVLFDLNNFNTAVNGLGGGGATGGNVTLGTATLSIASNSGSGSYAGAISGSGGIFKGGIFTQALTGCGSSYTGTTFINGGVLTVSCLANGGTNSAIGASSNAAGNLVLNGGSTNFATLIYNGAGNSTDRLFTLGSGISEIASSGNSGAIVFTNTGAIGFVAAGTSQTLTLGGANTGNNSLAAQITNNGAGVTSLVKTDGGTWILNNQNSTYTGITTISGGVLGVDKLANGGVASSIGASSAAAANLVIGNSSTLRYTGSGDTTNRLFTLSSGTTFIESSGTGAIVFTDTGPVTLAGTNTAHTIAVGGTNTGNNTLAGSIGDAGTGVTVLAKNDAGKWILTGNNTYTGNTNINAGTMILGNGGTTGSIASASVNNLGVLGFNRSDTLTYAGVIGGTGSVQQIGTGTTILTGDSNYGGGTTISAGTLQLGNGGTTGSVAGAIIDNGTLAFNHSNAVTYAGVISGTGSVHQMGPGTLTLSGANTYASGTLISGGGTVVVSSDANLGSAAGGITFDDGTLNTTATFTSNRDIVLAAAGTINTNNGTLWTNAGDITGAGSLTKVGNGTLILTGDATHTGGTTITAGTLQIGDTGATGSIAGNIVDNGALVFDRSANYTYDGVISGSGSVAQNQGTLTLTGDSHYGGATSVNLSNLRITAGNTVTSDGATGVNQGNLIVSGAGSTFETASIVVQSGAAAASISVQDGGVIRTTSGGLILRKTSPTGSSVASLNISGNNSLVDLAGAVEVADNAATSIATVTISSGGTLQSTGANQIGFSTGNNTGPVVLLTGAGSNWTSTGTLAMSNGSFSVLDGGAASFASATIGSAPQAANLLLSNANSSFTTTGDLTVGTGTGTGIITLSDAARLTVGGTFTLADVAGSTGVLNIGGAEGQGAEAAGFYDSPTLAFGAGTGRLNFNHTETNYTFAAAMSGAGTINQVAGVTNLTGNSAAFAGTTNVSGGTLKVNGTLGNAASVLNVLNGGTLGGAGTIGGNVSIADGILAPGNSPGTLTIGGNLALSAGSILNFEFGQANVVGGPLNDLVNVGGNLTLDGTINVTEPAGGTFGPGIYRVFNYGGTLTNNGLDLGTLPSGQTVQVQTSITGQVNLVNTTGLAFSFWDGAAGPKGNNVINGGNGTWHLAGADANWTNSTGAANDAWSDGTTAIFAGTAGTVTIDNTQGNVTAAGMQFATNGYILGGNSLTLVGPQAAIQVGDGSAMGAGYTATINAVLGGASQLVKTDLGTLVLTGANTYTGGTLISGGVLSVANDSFLGNTAGAVTIDGGTLQLTGASAAQTRTYTLGANGGGIDVTNAGSTFGVNNALTGSGGLTKLGAGSLILSADNSYTGGTTISAGTLQIGAGGTTGSIMGNVVDNATLRFNRSDSYTYGGSISGVGSLSVDTGILTLTGNSSLTGALSAVNVRPDAELRINAGNTVSSVNISNIGAGSTLTVSGLGSTFVASRILASAGGGENTSVNVLDGGVIRAASTVGLSLLTSSGTGSANLNISGAGSLADFSGSSQVQVASASAGSTAAITISDGGALRSGTLASIGATGGNTTVSTVTITGAGSNWTGTGQLGLRNGQFSVMDGGAASFATAVIGSAPQAANVLVSGTNSSFTTTGNLTLGFGTGTGVLTLADGGHVTIGGNLVLANGATATGVLNIGGAEGAAAAGTGVFDAATLNLGSATSRINFNHTDPDYVFTTVISGSGSVNQVAGTTTLTGANDYTGLITVSGGTLLINGNQTAATGDTNVNAGTLGGIGIIGGNVLVADGATLAPGDATGPGTLTINGNLGLSGASSLAYDFGHSNVVGGPLNDLTKVGGNLTLDGTIDVTVSTGGNFDAGLYRVISYGGALNDQGLALGSMPGGSAVGVQTSVAGQVNLVNSAGATVNFWDGDALANKFDNHVNGGDGIWQASAGNNNWADISGAFNNSYQDASFAIFAAAPGTVHVDNSLGAVTASGMQFASDGYTIVDDALTLTPGAVIRVGDGTADGANYTATIASAITGSDVKKTDLGTLVLTGTSTFSDSVLVANGTLTVASGGVVNSTGSAPSLVDIDANLVVTGTGRFNTTLDLVAGRGVEAASITVDNGGQLTAGRSFIGEGSNPSNGSKASAITVTVDGAGSAFNAGDTFQLAAAAGGTATLTISNGGLLNTNSGADISIGRGGDGSATVTGAGSQLLTDGNLYIGTSFNGGAGHGQLTIQNGGLVSTSFVAMGYNDGTTNGSTGALTIASGGTLEAGTLSRGFGDASITIDGGVLRATADNADFIENLGADALSVTLGANGGLIDSNGHDIGIAPSFIGTGALTKDGLGTLTLSGANAYAGATNVNAGTLFVDGDQTAATGLTTVLSGATLGGGGIIGGNVTVADGATLAPGSNGVGTLTIKGGLALNAGSILNFEFGQAGVVGGALNDLVNVGGNLTLDGTLNVTVPTGGTFGPGIYRVFNYGGALTDNGLALGGMPAGSTVSVQTAVAGQVNLVNTAGLALSFWDGDAGPKNNSLIDGGNGVWRLAGGSNNWTGQDGAINADYAQDSFAIFSATPGTVTIDNGNGDVRASGMQFASDGYVITGGPLTLTGAQAIVQVGDGSAASAGYTATIAAVLQGSAQLVKTDAGTLILTGANSYSGGTTISGGTLQVGNGGMSGSIIGDVIDNGTLAVNRSDAITLDGTISGTGSLTKLGGGTLTLTGTNSYAGGTLVGGGTVQITSDANLGDVAGTLSLQGGTLQAGAAFTSSRTILLGSTNSNSIDTQGFDVTLAGTIGDGPNNSAGDFVNKLGSGTLTLTGANTYANRTVIAGGTLALAGAGTIGAGNLVVGAGTVFDISQTDNGARVIQLNSGPAGTIALGSKTLTLGLSNSFSDWSGTIVDGGIAGGTGGSVVIAAPNGAVRFFAANSYTGGTIVAGGTFVLAGNGSLYSAGSVAVNAGAAFDISGLTGTGTTIGDLSGAGAIALGGKSLTFGTDNSTSFSGPITGTGGALVKTGTGTFTLSGANSYTGATDVTAGTLLVNGNQSAATGLTSVAAGATLGGIGTIGGNVTVADGGTLAPGAGGAGALTINGSLALSGGSALSYDFGAANAVGNPINDVVNVGGNLTLDGTINVAVTPGGSFGIGLYRVANYGGTLTDNGLDIGTVPAGADVSVQTSVANQVNLINTGGATLNFWDGAAGPKFNGAVDGGDGVWQNSTGNNNWADISGAVNAGYADGAFAIFTGAAGTVTVDDSLGTVTASGLQFAVDGYTITGDALTLTGPQATIRVGDGTAGGAAYTATIASAITGTSQLVKTDQGTLVLTGTNSYTGGTAINGGTVRIASDANLGDAAGSLSFDGGALNTTADLTSGRGVNLVGAGTFLTDAGTTLTLTGAMSGAGSLTKGGTGTLVLGGTGNYTGATNVGVGTLLVNGDYSAATGLTTIASGASLGGTGTIGGSVTLADGATLTPGAGGAGTLTIGGNLTLSGGTRLSYEFGQAGVAGGALNDLVNIGGNLTLDGTIDVTETAGGTFGPGIYRVINYGGSLTDNGLTLGGLPAGSNVVVQTSVAGQVNLINAAGATLTFWDGAAGPKNDDVINGGNGVWQSNAGNNNWTDADGIVNGGYSDGAFAVFQGTGGTVTVDNSLGQVTSGGMQFAANGYTITGQSIALTDPQTTIRVGDGSTAGAGFTATINTVLSGDTQLVKTDAGTLVLGGANTFTGGVAINGGTVQISSDANLGAAAGGLSLANGTLATTADITSNRNVTLAGAGAISTADATTFTLNGALSGTGALAKAGAGTLLLTGNSGGYTGATTVTGGTLAVTGSLGGSVAVNGGARLEGTGSVGAVTNAGTVAPGRNGFGTLTTAGYTGVGGKLEIETALGGDTSQTDLLMVNGATAGTTLIDVTNRGGLGAETVNGIKIIDVTGASNGVFALNGDYVFQGDQAVIAGAYGYRLYKGGIGTPTDGDWYLRSALINPSQPIGPQAPLYQPGVPVYEAYGQTLLSLTDLGTLQQRLGDRQQVETLSGKPSGIWGRMESKYARPNAAFSTSGADVDTNSWKAELGADQVLSERADGSSLVVGVIGSYGQANANIGSVFGNGSIKTKAYGAGATLTWFGPQGFYADSRAQFTWFDSTLKSSVLGKLADSNKGTGQAYSIEVGKRTPVTGTLSVTPQIQMVYSTVGFDTFTDPNGATVSSALGDSLKTRWGLSIDRQDAGSHLYAVGNVSYEWLDGTVTDVSGTPIAHSNDRLWGELGVGGSVLLGNRVTLYTEASANTALHDFGKSYSLKGTVGLRLAF